MNVTVNLLAVWMAVGVGFFGGLLWGALFRDARAVLWRRQKQRIVARLAHANSRLRALHKVVTVEQLAEAERLRQADDEAVEEFRRDQEICERYEAEFRSAS